MCAARLAGVAGLVFGWTPEIFWNATPAELAGLVRAAGGDAVAGVARGELARMIEADGDG